MKTIGIVGGIAPGSTIEYYRMLVDEYRARTRDNSYPPILINSINMTRMLDLINSGKLDETVNYLGQALRSLTNAGAEIGLLASNTPHIVFDELQSRSTIPLISIVRAACDAAKAKGLSRLGLLGTRSTMQGRFYPEAFLSENIEVIRPTPQEQEFIHDVYMNELVTGIFRPETKSALLAIIDNFKQRNSLDGIILGGTELPLLFRTDSAHGLPLLDTGRVHVEAVLQAAMA
ncbi:MAG TPA: amino acid racemase [Terriglobales bacterium]|nr:amino acid racemase [Terriglobales bacterium]